MDKKTTDSMFDLSELDTVKFANAGAEIELKHPITQAPTGLFVSVLGKESDAFRDLVKERADATLRRRALAEATGVDMDIPTAQLLEDNATDLLTICMTGWRTVTVRGEKGEYLESVPQLKFEGELLDFNHNNARKVITKLLWVRRQVDEAIGRSALFTSA